MIPIATNVEILEHTAHDVVINGWSVPLMQAVEVDGGLINLTVGDRTVLLPAEVFDEVTWFVADVIAQCFGYGAHPDSDDFDTRRFRRVPHPALQPRRVRVVSEINETEGE